MRRILRAQTLAINSITNSSRSNSNCSSSGDHAVEYGAAHLHCFLPPSSRPRQSDVLQAEGAGPI